MNERIAKLYDQAIMLESNGDYVAGELDPVKFAELIVRECISELEKIKRSGVPTPIQGGLNLGVVSLKEHFGVEESLGWVCSKCGTDRTKAVCPQGPSASVDGRCPMIASAQ